MSKGTDRELEIHQQGGRGSSGDTGIRAATWITLAGNGISL